MRKALYAGARRFGDFRSLGIATNVLASRLDGFVAAGIMETDGPEYLLTEQGRELATVVVALTAWGDRWLAPDGPPVHYTHTGCGGDVAPRLVCDDVRRPPRRRRGARASRPRHARRDRGAPGSERDRLAARHVVDAVGPAAPLDLGGEVRERRAEAVVVVDVDRRGPPRAPPSRARRRPSARPSSRRCRRAASSRRGAGRRGRPRRCARGSAGCRRTAACRPRGRRGARSRRPATGTPAGSPSPAAAPAGSGPGACWPGSAVTCSVAPSGRTQRVRLPRPQPERPAEALARLQGPGRRRRRDHRQRPVERPPGDAVPVVTVQVREHDAVELGQLGRGARRLGERASTSVPCRGRPAGRGAGSSGP